MAGSTSTSTKPSFGDKNNYKDYTYSDGDKDYRTYPTTSPSRNKTIGAYKQLLSGRTSTAATSDNTRNVKLQFKARWWR